MQSRIGREAYIDLHVLIESVIHDQTMCHSDTVRFHRMAGNIGVVTYIRVVKVRCGFGTIAVEYRLIERRKGSHIGRLSKRESDYRSRKVYFGGIDMRRKFM